jgi:type VI secretion system protein ImpM
VPRPTLKSAVVPGWFGKIPNLGDFASRRLPEVFIRPWDRWLQESLARTRSDLGDAWQQAYMVAPIQRFWVAPGALGSLAWGGLLMPSVDRVGRYFPLTIAQPFDSLAAALAARDWFAALDAAARRVLDVGYPAEALEDDLRALAALDLGEADAGVEQLAADLLQRCHAPRSCSVWWCGDAAAEHEGIGFLCFAGLPPAAEFASMLGVTT